MVQDVQSDLAYIRQMMEQTRRYTAMRGNFLIAWGALLTIGFVATILVVSQQVRLPINTIWIVLVAVGWVYCVWYGRWTGRLEPTRSYTTRLTTSLWIACGAAMTTAFFVGPWSAAFRYTAVGGLMALFLGIAVFMTGMLGAMNWFRNLAFAWWLGAIAMFIWHGQASLWISAGLSLALLLVPGVVLNLQARSLCRAEA